MDKIIIRKANINDINALNSLLYQVHKVHSDIRPDLFKAGKKKYTDEELISIINDENKLIFVAEIDNKVVAHAFCLKQVLLNGERPLPSLYIDDICVDKNSRHKHIATSLLNHIKEFAKENNFYNLTLNVWEGNDSAKAFYDCSGFKTLKTTMEYKI